MFINLITIYFDSTTIIIILFYILSILLIYIFYQFDLFKVHIFLSNPPIKVVSVLCSIGFK